MKEKRLEKRTLETDEMITGKSATKYNDGLDMVIHEQYTARASEA
ncbi:hypothetical protein ACWA1C_04660 [Flectobacillus roseus]